MRIGRQEILLIAGLAIGAAVAFSGQLSTVLEAMRDYESERHIGLLPGFTIAALTLLGFVQGKRRQLQRRATADAADVRKARDRAQRLERLVTFWQDLTESSDLESVRGVLERHLPEITGSGDVWVVAGGEGNWSSLLGPAVVRVARGETPVVDLAIEALSRQGPSARPEGIDVGGHVCFPMTAAGTSLGVLGLPAASPALAPERRLLVGATVALVGVSLNSLHLLQAVRESSLRDALTGCANRAQAMDRIASELARARRTRQPVSLVMFDVDRFKSINDRYGHLCGDTVLARVGAMLRASLRESDLKYRYGGEEFLILLPDTPLDGARHAAETLRRELWKIEVPWDGDTVRVTGSFGAACARPDELEPASVIARADQALYRAKREGRDFVCLAVDEPSPTPSGVTGDDPGR
jgi:diguanylate cyclase (GGDEF)-like protein